MSIQQNASVLKVLDAIRNLSGPSNIFVAEATILNSLRGFTQAYGDMQPLLASLVQANRLECFVPLIEKMGSCGPCGGDCCGEDALTEHVEEDAVDAGATIVSKSDKSGCVMLRVDERV